MVESNLYFVLQQNINWCWCVCQTIEAGRFRKYKLTHHQNEECSLKMNVSCIMCKSVKVSARIYICTYVLVD